MNFEYQFYQKCSKHSLVSCKSPNNLKYYTPAFKVTSKMVSLNLEIEIDHDGNCYAKQVFLKIAQCYFISTDSSYRDR